MRRRLVKDRVRRRRYGGRMVPLRTRDGGAPVAVAREGRPARGESRQHRRPTRDRAAVLRVVRQMPSFPAPACVLTRVGTSAVGSGAAARRVGTQSVGVRSGSWVALYASTKLTACTAPVPI